MFTNLTQRHKNIVSFMWKRTAVLPSILGTPEFFLFVLFILTCCFAVPWPIFVILLTGQIQPFNDNHCPLLLLFQVQYQKEPQYKYHEEVESWWRLKGDWNINILILTQKIFTAIFSWMGFNYLKATEPIQEGSFLFITKSSEIPGTHMID